mmetsp:Transcript_998/g.1277  ORF Transcript_998/g.1277 Transcript_998/m.1277 type:complete len:87 (+) Transcript_998:409-669(+)
MSQIANYTVARFCRGVRRKCASARLWVRAMQLLHLLILTLCMVEQSFLACTAGINETLARSCYAISSLSSPFTSANSALSISRSDE